ncbi:hypothetical protein, partial [uncultured Idiomarina sp.]
MSFKLTAIAVLFGALTVLVLTAPVQAKESARWVSLNQCIDIALARWSERQELVGITRLHDENELTGVARHNGTLESILAL